MSSSFAALMALSESQTRESTKAVQSVLADRQRREAQKRKEQEKRDRKEREAEALMRKRKLEREKEEQDRQRKAEEDRLAKERVAQRREEEKRSALLYGPRKASSSGRKGYPSRASRSRSPSPSGGQVLTREEKRERRLHAEMFRHDGSSKRGTISSLGNGHHRTRKHLAGGAIDSVTLPGQGSQPKSSRSGLSVRARLSAVPATLTKLNINKRDLRTIDEIQAEVRERRGAGKTLNGDDARTFNDWFGKTEAPSNASPASTPGATTPSAIAQSKAASPTPKPQPRKPVASSKPNNSAKGGSDNINSKFSTPDVKSSPLPRNGTNNKSALSQLSKTGSMKVTASSVARISQPAVKKRSRSDSRSESPPPKRRAHRREAEHSEDLDDDGGQEDMSNMIWSLFGRDRKQYVGQDVYSDDEDEMEVGASILEKEERVSARIARKEDLKAEEEQKRHEEAKRRKKKEAARKDSRM